MFFSVKQLIKIGDKIYKPCICYRVTPVLKATVEELAETGKAVKHEELVFFQNGKIIQKAENKADVTSVSASKKPKVKKEDKDLQELPVKGEPEEF